MKVQRLRFPDDSVSFTVVGDDARPLSHAEEYLRFLRVTASPNTVRAYARALARWFGFLDRVGVDWKDFETVTFGDFLTWLHTGAQEIRSINSTCPAQWLSPASVSQHAAAVVAFYTFQADAHGLTGPYDKLHSRRRGGRAPYTRFLEGIAPRQQSGLAYRIRPGNKRRPPVLTPQQVRVALSTCASTGRTALTRARDAFLFQVLWETGIRIGEALSLQHGDFSTGQGGTPWVEVVPRQKHPHGVRGKTAIPRRIYISDELENAYTAYLWALIDEGIDVHVADLAGHEVFVNVSRQPLWAPMRVETVYQKTRAIRAHQPELPPFTPHWFRHTHATTLLMAGTPPHVVMRRLGHADVQTTLNTYGWVTDDAELCALTNWQTLTQSWRGLA